MQQIALLVTGKHKSTSDVLPEPACPAALCRAKVGMGSFARVTAIYLSETLHNLERV